MEKMVLEKYFKEIRSGDAAEIMQKLIKEGQKTFLFESRDISHVYGRLSLIGVDPVLEISAKNENFKIESLKDRAAFFLNDLSDEDLSFCDEIKRNSNSICGKIFKDNEEIEEGKRTKRKNTALLIRAFLDKFKNEKKELLGLYGAFSYDFVRLFEDIPSLLEDDGVADFRLLLFDTFIYFDHLKDNAEIICFREKVEDAEIAAKEIELLIMKNEPIDVGFKIENESFDLSQEEYEKLVEKAIELAKEGEIFEVVFSNTLRARFSGESFGLYKKYREYNPSPYLFYFNFGDEQLIGASPEMMVRCEGGVVNLRPISGTAKRGSDPIEDHENMLKLLSDPKERAELDMLIDLGRNDLARICEPGIKVSDYRFVEKYSQVMHTVAHLSGKLQEGYCALDALIACINAGTLTGAPKISAMNYIEKNEKNRRGYYGGVIGYLTFSGDLDTGIIIRTAHIKAGDLSLRAGATLLYDSNPEAEYQETINKASAFLKLIKDEKV